MTLSRTSLQVCRREARVTIPAGMRMGVSLHGHSECSREKLTFLPGIARRIPVVAALFDRSMRRYEQAHGRPLDFSQAYWRPPLSPAAVMASEREQIEQHFDCAAIVSLTDHDTLEGPRALRALGDDKVPLSVEWSVPFDEIVLHLGVHGIPPAQVDEMERALAAYTGGATLGLGALLDWIGESPETLVVLNHPYWDLAGIGALRHEAALLTFLRRYGDRVHALELNGYRTWTENRRVLPLAEGFGLPVVGGGDRHGYQPNAIINATAATSLAEFTHEIRVERRAHCMVMAQYADPFAARLFQTAAGVLRDVPDHHDDRCRWSDRVFIVVDGVERSLDEVWAGVSWLRGSVAVTRLLGAEAFGPLFRLMRSDGRETLAADCWMEAAVDTVAGLETRRSAAVV